MFIASLLGLFVGQSTGINNLVEPNQHPTKIYVGTRYLTGPLWLPSGSLILSDVGADSEVTLVNGSVKKTYSLAHMPFGHAFSKTGSILACHHQTHSIVEGLGDSAKTIVDSYEGKKLNGPIDLVVSSEGTLYFTDPIVFSSSTRSDLGWSGVYSLTQDGKLNRLKTEMARPVGLALSNDGKKLYVSDSSRMCVKTFDVLQDGHQLGPQKDFCFLTGENAGAPGGIKLDCLGNVYCAGPGGVMIFNSQGKYLGLIYLKDVVTNFCFGDPDMKTLYITGAYGLYKLRMKVAGEPLTHSK